MALLVTSEQQFLKLLGPNHYSFIDGNGGMAWDVTDLWRLTKDFPKQKKPLADFNDIIVRWMNFGGKRNDKDEMIVPFNVAHFERIRNAELSYPILVIKDKKIHPNIRVADGMHRLMKSYLSNASTILTVEINQMPEPDIIYRKK